MTKDLHKSQYQQTTPHAPSRFTETLLCYVGMPRKEVERLYSDQKHASIFEIVEEDLSDILQNGSETLKGGSKNDFYVFIEHLIATMAHNEAVNNLFVGSIDRWTQLLVFMDVFTRWVLASSRFVRPVGTFIRENLREQSEVVDRSMDLLDSPFHFSQVETSPGKLSRNNKYRK